MRKDTRIGHTLCLMLDRFNEIVLEQMLPELHECMIRDGERKVSIELDPFMRPLDPSGPQPGSHSIAVGTVVVRQGEGIDEVRFVSQALVEPWRRSLERLDER